MADEVCLCTKYDVRCTIAIIARFARGSGGGENAAYVRCTMYDVRCTIAIIARFARENGRRRGKCVWTARMRCPKGENWRRPQAAAGQLLMYDVGCTMYDWKVRALCAGQQSKCERALMKLCAECGIAFVVASPVGLWYNPTAPAKANALGNAFAYVRCWMYDVRLQNSRSCGASDGGGERRADRKGDLLAVRDAQLAKSAPPRETEVAHSSQEKAPQMGS